MKSAASPCTSDSSEMHSPLMSPTVARVSIVGIGSTSKSRSSASRSWGTRLRKPAIIASSPRLNSCTGVARASCALVGVRVGSRRMASVWLRASRVESSEKASDVGSRSSSKTSPSPE